MATLIKSSGTENTVNPAHEDGGFTFEEMCLLIRCTRIETVRLADGRWMAVDHDFVDRPINEKATVIYQEGRNTGMAIRGHALAGTQQEIEGGRKDGKERNDSETNLRADR